LDGFNVSDNEDFRVEQFAEEPEKKDEEEGIKQDYEGEAKGTIEYHKKYTKQRNQTIKDRSEGNRFVKNTDL